MVNLTIGGGNFKGLAFLGALEYLHKNNLLTCLENFYGNSIGSVIGILYIIGYEPFELFNILLNINFDSFCDFKLENIDKHYSLITDKFFITLSEIFSRKESKDITVKEFCDKYSVNINIFAVSLKKRKTVTFNKLNYSNIKVLTAVQASCSIPFIFPPVNIDGEYFIDGCMKCVSGHVNQSCTSGYIIKLNVDNNEINNFSSYISEVLNTILSNEDELVTKNTICINLETKYSKKINFNDISQTDKVLLYYEGLKQAKKQFETI